MMDQRSRQQLLHIAFKRFGREGLARRLNVPPHIVDYWALGRLSVPDRKARLLVHLLDELGAPHPARSRA
jgi:hypothetical protein